MTRNVKIALGCGGAGCLGIILIVIVCVVLIFAGVIKAPGIYSPNSNTNYNYNRNSNSNSNTNSNDNENVNSNSENSNSSDSSSMSDDDKHKLFQAAAAAQDTELNIKVWKKLGIANASGTPTEAYEEFAKDHIRWAFRNLDFIQSINTPEKARAYVEEHIND